jgi:uncharacterized surface protein with fasciclin (FAS1) repeats
MRRRLVATLTASALALGIVAAPAAARPPASNSIVDVAIAVNGSGPYAGAFDTLIAALLADDANGGRSVLDRLSQKGQYTVFAPTDDAFAATLGELGLSAGDVLGNASLLRGILLYHVAPGERLASDVLDSTRIRTLNGAFLRQSGGQLIDRVGATSNATIIVTDVQASNGVIHAIDRVVIP